MSNTLRVLQRFLLTTKCVRLNFPHDQKNFICFQDMFGYVKNKKNIERVLIPKGTELQKRNNYVVKVYRAKTHPTIYYGDEKIYSKMKFAKIFNSLRN